MRIHRYEKGDSPLFPSHFLTVSPSTKTRILQLFLVRYETMDSKKIAGIAFIAFIWICIAWLLFPLITLDSVNMINAKQYLYRSAIGIGLMIILFGKTIFDLLFPQATNRRIPVINAVFLIIYSFLMVGGIIFMVTRLILLYIRNQDDGMPSYF